MWMIGKNSMKHQSGVETSFYQVVSLLFSDSMSLVTAQGATMIGTDRINFENFSVAASNW